jgi:WD40 repeat protein
MSALPPLQKRRQSISRATSQTFLLHGSAFGDVVTASDPITGQVFREVFSHPTPWGTGTQSMALHENIIAFGSSSGSVSIVNVNNRRKLDGGWKFMQEAHDIAVTALLILPVSFKVDLPDVVDGGNVSLFSASAGGEVLFHDLKTGSCHGKYRIPGVPTVPDYMIVYLDYDAETNCVVAGTCIGEVWTLNSVTDTELQRVSGTEYDKKQWEVAQEVAVHLTSARMSSAVPIHFLSDFKNDSIFLIRGTCITRYGIRQPALTEFSDSGTSVYTSATIDPQIYDKDKPRLLAFGAADGTVSVYNARTPNPFDSSAVPPLWTIIPITDTPITALSINPLVLVTGSQDGTAKVYSALNGTLLRTLCSPTSRRRRLRPPSEDPSQNPISSISLTTNIKHEVRGVIAFRLGHIRYWNFAPDGVGIVLRSKKKRRNHISTKEIKGFMNDEIERDVEEGIEDENRRKKWEKMNGGIEDDAALQIALMMSREEEERRREFQEEIIEEDEESEDSEIWQPGRKISFGSTSGSVSPAFGVEGERRLEDVAVFRRGRMNGGTEDDVALQVALMMSREEEERRQLLTTNAKDEAHLQGIEDHQLDRD